MTLTSNRSESDSPCNKMQLRRTEYPGGLVVSCSPAFVSNVQGTILLGSFVVMLLCQE